MRRGFIRKVLFIVFFQLLLTTGVAVAFYQVEVVRVRSPGCINALPSLRGCTGRSSAPWHL